MRPWWNGGRDQAREEFGAGQDLLVRRRERATARRPARAGALPGSRRGRPRTATTPAAGRRCAGRPRARRRAAGGRRSAVPGRLVARPAIISEKNRPIDSAVPEFWKVERIPDAAPRCAGRDAAHDRGRVGRAEHADADPVERDQQRERPVGEVDGQQHQPDEARAEQQHPGGGEAARAEPVRQLARRPGPEIRNAAVSGSR